MKLSIILISAALLSLPFFTQAENFTDVKKSFLFTKISTADTIITDCSKTDDIQKIIADAISLGAPIYNEGLHMACYRIYEWAAYKIVYVYNKDCTNAAIVLKAALDKSHGDYSDTEKAWLMRQAFDVIMHQPTETTPLNTKPSSLPPPAGNVLPEKVL